MELKVQIDENYLKWLIKEAVQEALNPQPPVVDLTPDPVVEGGQGVTLEELRELTRQANTVRARQVGKVKAREEIVGILSDSGAESLSKLSETDFGVVAGRLRDVLNGG